MVRFLSSADFADSGTGRRIADVRIDNIELFTVGSDGALTVCDNCPNIANTAGFGCEGSLADCTNDNDCFDSFKQQIQSIEGSFSRILKTLDWVSLGGGVAFTEDDYPLDDFCQLLKLFGEKYDIQVYLADAHRSL